MMRSSLLPFILALMLTVPGFSFSAGTGDTLPLEGAKPGAGIAVEGAGVAPFGQKLFSIHSGIGPISASKRARLAEQQIKLIADYPFFRSDSIRIRYSELGDVVMYGESIITSVFDADAKSEGLKRSEIVKLRRAAIITGIEDHRKATTLIQILKNAGFSLGILILFIVFTTLVTRLFRRISARLPEWQERIMQLLWLKEYLFFNKERQLAAMRVLLNIMRWLLILVIVLVSLLSIFYLLPWTKPFTITIVGFIINPLRKILVSLWAYIPNLITILVILFFTRLIIKFLKYIRIEVEQGMLRVPGFYPDWALPTFNILRVLVILFTIVAIWPYLPGSGSQIFQGVSVFFGLVFSLTSASAMSNFVAGLTLTYTRAFKLGDRVRIGEVTGDIIEKSMLVTKIRTIKNEEITVPNTKIMNTEVINYSTCAPGQGLILNTSVTIGYDAPWRQVHELLIDAAIKTPQILDSPKPFVLQTALNDFYVSYQINAYTQAPNEMATIYSHLHQNIQDSFNHAGVEIMSPHYKAIRDGNTIAIPEENRGAHYQSPAFKVES